MKIFIKDFKDGISSHMASVTLAMSPLALEDIDSRAPTETCHICMRYLARVRSLFSECSSNIPYIYLLSHTVVSKTSNLARNPIEFHRYL